MIEFRDVSKVYDNGTVALKDVNLRIDRGEFVFIVGASGAGKSTFLKTIMREEVPTSGSIMINNYDLTKMSTREIPYYRRTLGIVFQDFRLIPKMSVYDNVAFAMRVIGASEKEIKKRVPYVLTLVGLQDKANNMPNEISGGEQQRVALARALVNNANTIIADEPTGNVEHELVKQFDHRIVVIDNGEVVSDMANGGVLHYDSKTGYQPVPNVTEMKTITLHNVNVSYENSPVTQIIETEVPVRPSSSNVPDIPDMPEMKDLIEEEAEPKAPELSFTEATLRELDLEMGFTKPEGGEGNG